MTDVDFIVSDNLMKMEDCSSKYTAGDMAENDFSD